MTCLPNWIGEFSCIFADVKEWRGWTLINDPLTPREEILALVRGVVSVCRLVPAHTTEAGFHMFGRLPKHEVRLIQALSGHKAEEAEHGVWAQEDYSKIGGTATDVASASPSPATFAVAVVGGVWRKWRSPRLSPVQNTFSSSSQRS